MQLKIILYQVGFEREIPFKSQMLRTIYINDCKLFGKFTVNVLSLNLSINQTSVLR